MMIPLTPIRFLYRAERQFGPKTAVVDGEQRWTYRQFGERCRRLARLLSAWNLKPHSRVAYLSHNTHHLLEAYFGVLLAGGILLPLNIRLTAEDFHYILNDAEADILFLQPEFAPSIAQIRKALRTVRRFVLLEGSSEARWLEPLHLDPSLDGEGDRPEFDILSVDEQSTAELFYTSGTTGNPKGVMLTHRNLYLHALQVALASRTDDESVHLHTIPLFHVNGWGTPQALTCMGGTHVLLSRFEPEKVLKLIEREKVTSFFMVPTMANTLLASPALGRYDTSSLRFINLGGAAANPELIRKLEQTFQCECLSGYGMTETSPVLTMARPKAHLKLTAETRHALQSMTGYPIAGVELEIVDQQGNRLPWDGTSVGEIIVRSDTVMKGYWKLPQETAEVMQNHWFHTGDLATIDSAGYVQIVDRKKDIIISGGENISSIEVEKAIADHPRVLEVAVIPVPDPVWGEVPRALVVVKKESRLSEAELLEFCRSRLAHFKCPAGVDFFDSLPKGGTGKILKRELREKYWAGRSRRVQG